MFRSYRFVIVKMLLIYQNRFYKYYFDTGYIISFIDKAFFYQIIKKNGFYIDIKKISFIKVRDLGIKEYNVCEYTIIFIYISNNDNDKIALIRREIHVVDNFLTKTFIDIDIIKFEAIVLDINKDLIIIGSCDSFQISMSMVTKGFRTDVVVINKTRFAISTRFSMAISIKSVDLSSDRDLMFESEQLDELTLSIHIVDHSLSRIVIRNDTDLPITLTRYVRFDKVFEYEAEGCYSVQIDMKYAPMIEKSFKKTRSRFLIKQTLRKIFGFIIIFNTVISSIFISSISIGKIVHYIGVTIYDDVVVIQTIVDIADFFLNLWKDIDNVVNISKDQWMEIPLVDNWKNIYKTGQTRVYPVNTHDKQMIDETFDKLYNQKRIKWIVTNISFIFSCFVVRKNIVDDPKNRVIIDIKTLNKIIILNIYLVSIQSEILIFLKNVIHIFIVDTATFFYQ